MIYAPLTPDHAARCAEFERVLFPEDSPWSIEIFLDELAHPSTFYLGAFIGDEPDNAVLVGYAGVAMRGRLTDPEFEISTIGVDPAYQGLGIGRELMNQLLAVTDHHGGPVFLEVRTDNAAAIGLYESLGFSITGTRKNYYQPSGADAYTMSRPRT